MPSLPTVKKAECYEGETPKWSLVIRDHEGAVLGSSDLSTLTLTYTNFATSAAINSRSAQDVLNDNDCTLSSGGAFVWNIRTLDTIIVDAAATPIGQSEKHKAVLIWTWTDANTVTQVGKAILELSVINL